MVCILVGCCRCVASWRDLGVTFNVGSVRMFSAVTFHIYLISSHKTLWIAATDFICSFLNCAISMDSYTSINKFYRFITFNLQVKTSGAIICIGENWFPGRENETISSIFSLF